MSMSAERHGSANWCRTPGHAQVSDTSDMSLVSDTSSQEEYRLATEGFARHGEERLG
jgi:hypothetical protein